MHSVLLNELSKWTQQFESPLGQEINCLSHACCVLSFPTLHKVSANPNFLHRESTLTLSFVSEMIQYVLFLCIVCFAQHCTCQIIPWRCMWQWFVDFHCCIPGVSKLPVMGHLVIFFIVVKHRWQNLPF